MSLKKDLVVKMYSGRKRKNTNVYEILAPHIPCVTSLTVIPKSKCMKSNSSVWKYYGPLFTLEGNLLDDTHWYCQPCVEAEKEKFPDGDISNIHNVGQGTATGNMKTHLVKCHKIDADSDKDVPASPKPQVSVKQKQLFAEAAKTSAEHRKLTQAAMDLERDIVVWFCTDLESFDKVEKPGMKKFFEKHVDIQLPTRSSLEGTLVNMYKDVKSLVKGRLQDSPFMTLMFDGWMDRARRLPFLAIRASTITPEWDAEVYTLSVVPIEDHSSTRIRDRVKDVIYSFSNRTFEEMTLHTVHDGAADMFAASRLLNVADPQHCTAHSLHLLLTTDGFSNCPEVSRILEKVKEIFNALHYGSYVLSQEMLYCNDMDAYDRLDKVTAVHEMLQLDDRFSFSADISDLNDFMTNHNSVKARIPLRWNTSLDMLESYFALHETASNMLRKIEKVDLLIDEDELLLIKSLKDFLASFTELTEIVSDATNSLSVIPLVKAKICEICVKEETDRDELKVLKSQIATNVEHRFAISETAKLASTLNPAIRDVMFAKDDAKAILKANRPNVAVVSAPPDEPEEPKSKLLKLMQSMKSTSHSQDDYADEVDRYLSHRPAVDEQENCLLFWQRNERMYPSLACLAKEYLAIPSSSMPVEDMFSTNGLSVNAKRSSLNGLTMNMISFMHDNMKHTDLLY